MRRATLPAMKRMDAGKGVARKARAAGRLPAVIYGESQPPENITIDGLGFKRIMVGVEGHNIIVTLDVEGGDTVMTLVKEIQSDPVKGFPMHVDFLRINTEHTIHTEIPIHIEGTARGIREGGILEFPLRSVEITCLPQDIPDYLPLSVREMAIGDVLHVSDLVAPERVEILTDPERPIVSIISTAKLAAAEPEEGEGEEGAE